MNDLQGWKLMNTRAVHQAASLSSSVKNRGGAVVELPLIRITYEDDQQLRHLAFQAFQASDWAVFTSANSVDATMNLLSDFTNTSLPELFAKKKTAAIGEKTKKRLEECGLSADILPDTYDAEHFASLLVREVRKGETVFYPKSKRARTVLYNRLTEEGIDVRAAELYDTVAEHQSKQALEQHLLQADIDVIMFASPSAVHSYYCLSSAKARSHFEQTGKYAVIGPVTLEALEKYHSSAMTVPDRYTIEGMLDHISQYHSDAESKKEAE